MNLTAGRPNSGPWAALACRLVLLLAAIGRSQSAVAPIGAASASNSTASSRPSTKATRLVGDGPMQINANKTNNTSPQNKPPAPLSQAVQSLPSVAPSGGARDWPQSGLAPADWAHDEPGSKNYKLPSWFNHNAFKQLYGKRYGSRFADELHKRIYLETALKVFHQRALYRTGRLGSLASVNELSDLTSEQLAEFRERHRRLMQSLTTTTPASRQPAARDTGRTSTDLAGASSRRQPRLGSELPQCCSYDQVYARIIGMLSAATSANDTALSRALVDELEQRALVEEPEASQVGADFLLHSRGAQRAGDREGAALYGTGRDEAAAASEENSRRAAIALALDEQIALVRSNTLRQQQRPAQPTTLETGGNRQKTYHQQAAFVRPDSDGQQRQQADAGQAQSQAQVIERSQPSPTEVVTDGQQRGAGPARGPNLSAGSNRLAGGGSGAADEEQQRPQLDSELSRQIGEAVHAQLAEQLSPSSPTGRELNKQLSAYFGQPVELRTRLLEGVAVNMTKEGGAPSARKKPPS